MSSFIPPESPQTHDLQPALAWSVIWSPELNHLQSAHFFTLLCVPLLLVLLCFAWELRHRLGKEDLNELISVVARLLERVRGINPVKDDVTSSLMSQLKDSLFRDLILLDLSSSQHEESLVRLVQELVWLTHDGSCGISVVILFDTYESMS